MFKRTIALISAILLLLSISACKEEKSNLNETKSTTSATEKSTTEAKSTEPKTTTITTTKRETTTETTQRVTTTVEPTIQEDFKTSLNTPDECYLYADGNTEKVSNDLISKILPQVNIYLNDTKLGVLKLAVTEDMIEEIKSQNKAVELIYNSEQTYVLFQRTGGPDKYNFEKVLIPLDGERKGYVFFCKDGTYQNGPLKLQEQKAINEILSMIKSA